jgi:Flp pilus assembly pilin Flp
MRYQPRQEEGQGFIEYAIVLIIIGVALVGTVLVVGPIVGGILEDVGEQLA